MPTWKRRLRLGRGLLALAAACAALAAAAGAAWAHEGRQVQGFAFETGFLVEPAYEGHPNAVFVAVTRTGGDAHAHAGVSGLADTLRVEVTHVESGATRAMALAPWPDQAGAYVARFVPTAPGKYRFRFVGDVEGRAVDETFTSGPDSFDAVQAAQAAQFPVELPSARELAGVSEAAQQRADAADERADFALLLAVSALFLGLVCLALSIFGIFAATRWLSS